MRETIKIALVKPNPSNPRIIKDDKFIKLVKSIKEFPKMLELRPIVVNDDMVVLGGNMRLKACKEAGLKEVPIIKASDLTEEEQKEFIIKDNVGFGEWDFEMLADWDSEQLEEWGLDIPNWSKGHDINNTLTDDDVDLDEEFNPVGNSNGKQRVVFLFDGPDEAESYLNSIKAEFVKRNMAWQVDLSTQSI